MPEKKNKFALVEGAVWGDKIFQDGVSLDQLEGLMHPNHARKMGDLYEKFARLNRLRDTVLQGDVDGARRILDENKMCVDVPVRDDEKNIFMTLLGLIALRPALKNGVKLMEMLIAHEASINARSDLGQTALILACKAKNIPAAQLLIASGARLNAVDRNGWSAICSAASLVDGQEPTEFGMASSVLIDLLVTNGAAKDGEEDPANQEVRRSAVPIMVAVQYNNYHALLTLMQ
jgi:ankyrin repeat protein